MRYAKGTEVSSGKSREEVEKVLRAYGADSFVSAWKEGKVIIEFSTSETALKGLRIRFEMRIPSVKEDTYRLNKWGNERHPDVARESWEKDVRQHWRALALLVKAKMAAVEAGITTFEEEFLSHVVVPIPGGTSTVGKWFIPQLPAVYENGKMPPLLPEGGTEVG